MKASEVHRIVASVLDIAEKAQFSPKVDVGIDAVNNRPDRWKMVIPKSNVTLEELTSFKNKLGQNFTVLVSPRDRGTLIVTIEAPSGDFIALNH